MLERFKTTKILKTALKNGGDFADLYFENVTTTQIVADDKKIEKALAGSDRGIGLRVLSQDKTAYGYTSDLSERSLMDLADGVAAAVHGKKFDKTIVLHEVPAARTFPAERPPEGEDLVAKTKLVRRGEDCAWKADPKILQVKVVYGDIHKQMEVANSLGEWVREERTYCVYYVQLVATHEGVTQTGYHVEGGVMGLEMLDLTPPEEIAQQAVRQALLMLSARKAPGGTMPVVLSAEAGGTMVHEAVGHGLEADLACEGLSVYCNKLEQQVASPLVTVVDDATLPKKRGSFAFDDEGTPSERTILVEKGVLKNYMFDRRMALREGKKSTGNGRRQSYRNRPICRMTNTMIASGTEDPASILHQTEQGLFVARMGGGQVNTVTGDFVFEVVEGYLIDKGKKGEAVRGATLTGNGPRVLKLIDKVGSDLGYGLGTCGKEGQGVPVGDAQPTLRIPEIVVGGAV